MAIESAWEDSWGKAWADSWDIQAAADDGGIAVMLLAKRRRQRKLISEPVQIELPPLAVLMEALED